MLNTRGRAGFVLVKGVRSGHSCAVKIVENIHQHAAEQGLIKNGTLKKGIEPKVNEFVESGVEVYAKA